VEFFLTFCDGIDEFYNILAVKWWASYKEKKVVKITEKEVRYKFPSPLENRIYCGSPKTKNCRYMESIRSMRKPVISSEISPKFDGVKTCDFLPVAQAKANSCFMHIS